MNSQQVLRTGRAGFGRTSSAAALAALALATIAPAALAGGSTSAPSAAEPDATAQRRVDISVANGQWHKKHAGLLKRTWGIDVVGVHPVSSGYMLAFKYRILDAEKAKALNTDRSKAYLVDDATGTVLAVPAMENIGELRSLTTPQPDRVYFMIFGNPGRLVKPGSKVSIVAGDFRVQGLVVE